LIQPEQGKKVPQTKGGTATIAMNPYLLEMELRQRRREMIEEARRLRLVALYNAQNNQRNSNRLMLAIADVLINLGETLKRRHGQIPALSPSLCGKE
jgi:hypothetical protein